MLGMQQYIVAIRKYDDMKMASNQSRRVSLLTVPPNYSSDNKETVEVGDLTEEEMDDEEDDEKMDDEESVDEHLYAEARQNSHI